MNDTVRTLILRFLHLSKTVSEILGSNLQCYRQTRAQSDKSENEDDG